MESNEAPLLARRSHHARFRHVSVIPPPTSRRRIAALKPRLLCRCRGVFGLLLAVKDDESPAARACWLEVYEFAEWMDGMRGAPEWMASVTLDEEQFLGLLQMPFDTAIDMVDCQWVTKFIMYLVAGVSFEQCAKQKCSCHIEKNNDGVVPHNQQVIPLSDFGASKIPNSSNSADAEPRELARERQLHWCHLMRNIPMLHALKPGFVPPKNDDEPPFAHDRVRIVPFPASSTATHPCPNPASPIIRTAARLTLA